jgi:serine/threonine protein kinase
MDKASLTELTDEQIHRVLQHALESSTSLKKQLLNVDSIEDTTIQIQLHDNGTWNPTYFISIYRNSTSTLVELVLKVTNPYWKRIKTLNEALVMKFLFEYVPDCLSPEIISYDSTGELIEGVEYILMRRCEGIPLSDIYSELSDEDRKFVIQQMVQVRNAISGVTYTSNNEYLFGCIQSIEMIDTEKRIARATIGPNADNIGPSTSFEDYVCNNIRHRYYEMEYEQNGNNKYAISKFDSFCRYLEMNKKELCSGEYTLCHIDLQPHNIIVNPETKQITGVIDWEWAQLSVIDEDFYELFDESCKNEEEKNYLIECLKKCTNFDFETIWKGYQSRQLAIQLLSDSLDITRWPRWFTTDPEEGLAFEKLTRQAMNERFLRFEQERHLRSEAISK